ncbi:MAG: hypothetical protein KBE04_11115 [Phycisphaerae bacterium]|nr:hypothetical protein [Phycisphaerae bacterium]
MVLVGAACVGAILAFMVVPKWWGHWSRIRTQIREDRLLLEHASAGEFNPPGLASMVPVFEMPKDMEAQKILFREEINRQLMQARMPSAPLQIEPVTKQVVGKFGRLSLKYKGTCRFDSLLDFLATLKNNRYYAGVDELVLKVDPKRTGQERQNLDVEMTISTLFRTQAAKGLKG